MRLAYIIMGTLAILYITGLLGAGYVILAYGLGLL